MAVTVQMAPTFSNENAHTAAAAGLGFQRREEQELDQLVISQTDLKRLIASFPESTERTRALETRIQIGTGFHNKWYRSQKEHWLGWLVAKDCEARRDGIDPSKILAVKRWNPLNCSPMMIWLADCASVDTPFLDAAERAAEQAARINEKDGPPHGKLVRGALPWSILEPALKGKAGLNDHGAEQIARQAFDRLCDKRGEFRKLREWL